MDSFVAPTPEASSLPDVQIPAWAWAVVAFAAAIIYFVTMENGAALGSAAGTLHEFFHDGRHFSAIPCH
ncbi:CbtB-domain containing protein [uncultured Ilumatobacter sp.]|jgi:hypothetical protein|uniref:CbtB domain-containing protein n=1 Tax=uncultured Ilumatobacter sp. TaxID=879968 RepID=UPI00374F9251|tara:strand:- start:310 stop:516 length:207 start_codon:yes stop_codon:yes gene_type:complete